MKDCRTGEVVAIEGTKIRVRFPEDESASTRLYSTMKHYTPQTGDTVVMLPTSTGFICFGAVNKEGGA